MLGPAGPDGGVLVEDLGGTVAVADDDDVAAALETVDGGADGIHADGPEGELAVGAGLEGTATPEAEVPTLRQEGALHLIPPNGDIGDYVAAPTLRTLQPDRAHTRRILSAALVLLVVATAAPPAASRQPQVLPGVDVLVSSQSEILAGKRVGLITHRAATGVGGWPTATILTMDPRIHVVALFAPEHGYSGTLPAGAPVPSTMGKLPVYSLYAGSKQPSAEMLAGVDVLVFDLQDVGVRAYTYISTMALAMQAAAEHGKLFVVLDRPNPLGGERVDGPVLDPAFASFIGIYPLPAVHGMTVGELAALFNQEFGINARLTVVPMRGWRAPMQWEDTGLLWFRPSPTITSPTAAQLHAVTGLLEGTNLTVGAGTNTPYETVTAQWLQGAALATRLNQRRLPGVRFEAVSVGTGVRRKSGVRLVLTDVRQFQPATTAVHILAAVRQLHPGKLQFIPSAYGGRHRFDLVWGTNAVRMAILRGDPADRIVAGWQDGLLRFRSTRQRYFIYDRNL